ncbi:MAG: peptidylprolyl isomerase, partial [Draconibacterium sp.]|nr:peptidylprolyl isomerase [Draconibacterium sp.]
SNPEKRSSATQYYIVHGEIFTHGKLDSMETMKNSRIKSDCQKKMFKDATSQINEFRENNDQDGFNIFVVDLREKVDSIFEADLKFSFTDEQRKIYTTIGGYPSLDGDYTVFGEVVEGLDILDKIAAVETDDRDRPIKDIKMQVEMVK